jgi:uncharacterized protein DUF4253
MSVAMPDDGELRLGSIALPAGRQVVAGFGSGEPVAWATVEPVSDPGETWRALSDIASDTGLVPFLLAGLDDTTDRPWDAGEFSTPADVSVLPRLDAGELLAELWGGEFEDDDEDGPIGDGEFAAMIAPFSRGFPGLAPASDEALTRQAITQALSSLPPARIGLVPASRPADALPLLGWDGAGNYWENALVIAAVPRSWEDRFATRLLRVGFAEIQLLATARHSRASKLSAWPPSNSRFAMNPPAKACTTSHRSPSTC